MRMSWAFYIVLVACSSHGVRCDRHLLPINQPGRPLASSPAPAPASATAPPPTTAEPSASTRSTP
jgi:hypothetical protein